MKKFALLTALMLCLGSFAACGDEGSDSSDKKSSSNSAPGYAMNDDDEPQTEETTEEPETEPKTEAQEDVSYVRGTVRNGTYSSEFADFTFDGGSKWYFASDAEILQMMGLAGNADASNLEKLIANQTVIYDAHAIEIGGARNIIFMFENVRKEGGDPAMITTDTFLEILKVNLNSSPDMEYSNFTDTDGFELGGYEYRYFTVNAKSEYGVKILQTYAGRMIGDYFFGVLYTSGEDDFSSLISSFGTAS